jgi:hypothetical protein
VTRALTIAGFTTLLGASLLACTTDTDSAESELGAAGSLIKMEMSSTVGVLLDDVPAGPMREAAAANALAQPASFWTDRATRQVRLTYYRLVFRGLYYNSSWSSGNTTNQYGPLPLPDKSVWNVKLTGTPHRATIGTGTAAHDMVVVDYAFDTRLVTDLASPGKVDPNLGTIGGTTDELFTLPTDPDLLVERTGNACIDEDEYPANSYFEENSWYFYDDTCVAGSNFCHLYTAASESCPNALKKRTGVSATAMHFTRLPYDTTTADKYRVGTITNPNGADLAVIQPAMTDERRIVWRYFAPGSCELEEGVIAKLGWRRLMMFSAVVQNNGTDRVHIGDLTDATNPWLTSHVFEWSACHGHYHFSHYGEFNYNGAPGSKRAFCLEDTNRFHNDEHTPLTAEHQSCHYQGIGAGWGDEYEFGIPGQWVDITDVDATKPHDLTFNSNPDAFLCEGRPVLDANGQLIFDPTSFKDAAGETVSKVRCAMPSTWHDNNLGSVSVSSPGGSYVTDACALGQIGPNRDCGFRAQTTLHSCAPGSTVALTCTNKGAPQTLRVCEKSAAQNVGVACSFRESTSNTIVNGPTMVTFACPEVRDQAGMGGYSVYTASVVPAQGSGSVSCTGW